jgi:hypothetical protein
MATPPKSEGFGFVRSESEHHFLVTIPASNRESVYISEHYTCDETPERHALNLALGSEDDKIRVILGREKWNRIADEVRVEFNNRLRKNGLKPGQWKIGENQISRLLGKELVLLAWAIEESDPALIPVAVRNWVGLAPEERWWLFTMTNAATGHALTGRNKGWRKAVRYALTENPVSDHRHAHVAEFFELMQEEARRAAESGNETDEPVSYASVKKGRKR